MFLGALCSRVPGLDVRLPTEAEWEFACRGGSQTSFWFGRDLQEPRVNCRGVEPGESPMEVTTEAKAAAVVPVKSLPPNPWGLYEMNGNVWEWCFDEYGPYEDGIVVDPFRASDGVDIPNCVARGGSYASGPSSVRSGQRGQYASDFRAHELGFRIAQGRPLQREAPAEFRMGLLGGTRGSARTPVRRRPITSRPYVVREGAHVNYKAGEHAAETTTPAVRSDDATSETSFVTDQSLDDVILAYLSYGEGKR